MNRYLRARARFKTMVPDSFIDRSNRKVTQAAIDGLGMVVSRDGKRMFNVPATMAKRDVKTVLKSMNGRR